MKSTRRHKRLRLLVLILTLIYLNCFNASAIWAQSTPSLKEAPRKQDINPPKGVAVQQDKGAKAKGGPSTPPIKKVDINTATKEELQELPGIGPVKAQAIIEHRPYSKIEDIKKVKGIKEGTYKQIKDLITVR